MPQGKSQGTDDQDPGQLLQQESNQERREEEGGAAWSMTVGKAVIVPDRSPPRTFRARVGFCLRRRR